MSWQSYNDISRKCFEATNSLIQPEDDSVGVPTFDKNKETYSFITIIIYYRVCVRRVVDLIPTFVFI